jgi:glycosyltransferase involved in cell wall biosynthesis
MNISKTLRVLHVFKRMNLGGAETFIMNVYRKIDRKQVQFDFAVHSSEPGHYDEEIRNLGGRLLIIPNPKSLIMHVMELRSVIRNQGPFQAVHSHVHYFSGFVLREADKLGVPVRISHSHTTHDERLNSFVRTLYRKWMRKLIRRHATVRMGCSDTACHSLYGRHAFQDQNVQVVANGIDLPNFIEKTAHKRDLRLQLSLPQERILIGQIGRFDPVKNHQFTLEIFRTALQLNPKLHLVLIGEGQLRLQMEQATKDLDIEDNVTFYGVTNDIPNILHALDLLIMPSIFEGLGLALIEAQAAGVPVVCSDGVPTEADMSLGLMKRLNLSENRQKWAEALLEQLNGKVPESDIRYQVIKVKGFDIQASTEKLRVIYAKN